MIVSDKIRDLVFVMLVLCFFVTMFIAY